MKELPEKYTCFIFGEGREDIKFLIALTDHKKFKYHCNKWTFQYDNASGSSPKVILEQCKKLTSSLKFQLILCFIDLDQLKHNYPKNWRDEKAKLEYKYPRITIIWQIDNLEDEYKKVFGNLKVGKYKLNKIAKSNTDKFVNTRIWKKLIKIIKDKEKQIESK